MHFQTQIATSGIMSLDVIVWPERDFRNEVEGNNNPLLGLLASNQPRFTVTRRRT